MDSQQQLTINTVGDISFRGRNEDSVESSPFRGLFQVLEQGGFCVGNLESPLLGDGVPPQPGKCTLRGAPGWAQVLKDCGFHLVSLANNHLMDFGEAGLFSTMAALDRAGIKHVGAGKNMEEACRPLIYNISGKKVAFLARSSVEVSSPCYATADGPGVAFLEESELLASIRECSRVSDLTVVILHWGMEHYHYPSPPQRALAREIVSAGADVLLGHHPHVLQGEEFVDGALVSYSSGNFLFDEFEWDMRVADGGMRRSLLELTRPNREGMVLQVQMGPGGGLTAQSVFTRVTRNAILELDDDPARGRQYRRISANLKLPLYPVFWKAYSLKREWDLRLSRQFSLSHLVKNLHKIRPHHFKEMALKMRRSARVSSGKSTNPYED